MTEQDPDTSSTSSVADLVVKLHDNIDSIRQCIQGLSDTSSHSAELDRLSSEREAKIAELRAAHEEAVKALSSQRELEEKELAERRKKEQDDLEETRKKEYEELMARRAKEDGERKAKLEKEEEERARLKKDEDERREKEREEQERTLQEKVESELERLEDEMERKVEEGKRALSVLDEKRKAINAQIDAALNTPTVIPTIHFRSRAKTLGPTSRGVADSQKRNSVPAEENVERTESDSKPTSPPVNKPTINGEKTITEEPPNESKSTLAADPKIPAHEDKPVDSESTPAPQAKPEEHNDVSALDEEGPEHTELREMHENGGAPEVSGATPIKAQNAEAEIPEESLIEKGKASDTPVESGPEPAEVTAPTHNGDLPAPEAASIEKAESTAPNTEESDDNDGSPHESKAESTNEGPIVTEPAPLLKAPGEDPEDVKAREEIARLNAELFAVVAEEELPIDGEVDGVTRPETPATHEKSLEMKELAAEQRFEATPTPTEDGSNLDSVSQQDMKEASTEIPGGSIGMVEHSANAADSREVAIKDKPEVVEDQPSSHGSHPIRAAVITEDPPTSHTPEEAIASESKTLVQADHRFDKSSHGGDVDHEASAPNHEEGVYAPQTVSTPGHQQEAASERPLATREHEEPTHKHEVDTEASREVAPEPFLEETNNQGSERQISQSQPEDPSGHSKPAAVDSESHKDEAHHESIFESEPVHEEEKSIDSTPAIEGYSDDRATSPAPVAIETGPQADLPASSSALVKDEDELVFKEHAAEDIQYGHDSEKDASDYEPKIHEEFREPDIPEEVFQPGQSSEDQAYGESNKSGEEPKSHQESAPEAVHQIPDLELRVVDKHEEYQHPPEDDSVPEQHETPAAVEGEVSHPDLPEGDVHQPEEPIQVGTASDRQLETEQRFSAPAQRESTSEKQPPLAPLVNIPEDHPVEDFTVPEDEETPSSALLRESFSQDESLTPMEYGEEFDSHDVVADYAHDNNDSPESVSRDEFVTPMEYGDQQDPHDILAHYTPSRSGSWQEANEQTREDDYGPPPESVTEAGNPHHDYAIEEPHLPSTVETTIERPMTPVEQKTTGYEYAESPVTVVNADDLFADDDSDEEGDNHSHMQETDSKNEARKSWTLPDPEIEEQDSLRDVNVEQDHDDFDRHPPAHKSLGLFASLVDTIRSEIPLVRHIVGGTPAGYDNIENYHPNYAEEGGHIPGQFDEDNHYSQPYEPGSGLRIRTHTADIIPLFESYAHSEDSSTSPSEAASSPFEENPPAEPNIRTSWQDNSRLQEAVDEESHRELKPQASPLRGEFDPYNSQTYSSYITPNGSHADLQARDTNAATIRTEYSPSGNGSLRQNFPTLDTYLFANTIQAYGSPISRTSSLSSQTSFPQDQDRASSPSRIPRRTTASDRLSTSTNFTRTPVSSPSIPTNHSSFFQKTRSLFEEQSSPQNSPSPSPSRPLSGLFTVGGRRPQSPKIATGLPSPKRTSTSRPSSLYMSDTVEQGAIVPKSLDRDGKPPSPAFSLHNSPRKTPLSLPRQNSNTSEYNEKRASTSFLSRRGLVPGAGDPGSGGLEDSIHNPTRHAEKERLLGNNQGRLGGNGGF